LAEPSRSVFLSYASQDSEAAQKICQALRAVGIEVWFDQSELRGGDAWDQSIRRQIKSCSLFVPLISRHTHERAEGYFRLEWKLGIDRSHLIMANKAFLLPVVIDDTGDDDENVPDKFREIQWTRLPGGETAPSFVERVQRLLAGEASTTNRAAGDSPRIREGAAKVRTLTPYLSVAVAGLILAGAAYFAIDKPWMSKSSALPVSASAASIAVLPLTNESGDPSQQYFSDGISEDLITTLSQFQGLKVIGRTSSFQFRASEDDSRSIGAKLGVAHLLEGSVQRSGGTVRVNAELINTADGSTEWSQRFDRPYGDLFALQDEITRAVAGALRLKLLPGGQAVAQSDRSPGGSLEAYNALMLARFYAYRSNERDFRKAIEYYTQATQLDPRYALAWSGMAEAWAALGYAYLSGAPAQQAYVKAREDADRATEISPDLASAYLIRGLLLQLNDFNWSGADAEFRRALALAPNDGQVMFYVGNLRATFGDVDGAIELTRQALIRDPLRANWYNWLAIYLSAKNSLDEAESAIHKAIELQPTGAQYHGTLTIIEVQRGNAQAALAAAQQEAPGSARDAALALARQIGGDQIAADAALSALIDKDAHSAAYWIADVYALRNQAGETFAWLDRAVSNHDANIPALFTDPFILRYRDDPRFAAFCRKVGLLVPHLTTLVTGGGVQLPSRIEGRLSFGQYMRKVRLNAPSGAGNQFDSRSFPGESL
jgi:TolB-like protein/Tfp pilus assembly protein PilF